MRVLRITGGHDMTFLPAEELTAAMTRAGLQVTVDRRVDQGRPHPHHPLVGRAATWQPHPMAPSPVPRGDYRRH